MDSDSDEYDIYRRRSRSPVPAPRVRSTAASAYPPIPSRRQSSGDYPPPPPTESPPRVRIRSSATGAYHIDPSSRRQSTREYQPYSAREYSPPSRKSTAETAPRAPKYFKSTPRSRVRIDDAPPTTSYPPPPPPRRYSPPVPSYGRSRYKSRSRRSRYTTRYSSDDDSPSSVAASFREDAGDVGGGPSTPLAFTYSFVPSRSTKTESSLDSGNGAVEDDSSVARLVQVRRGERPPTVAHVVRSQYTGKNSLGDSHTAELTEVTTPGGPAQPIFRWIHYNWQSMDFDAFTSEVAHTPDVTSAERKGLVEMLKDVKRKSVKTVEISRGRHVSHMEPGCFQEYLPADNSLKGQTVNPRTVTWVCLPYFTLEKYSGLEGASSSSAFPLQTLLQAQFSRVARGRDMQQVVTKDRKVPSGYCYHIAQLWCLVLDNSVLFTCSRASDSALCRETIKKSISQASAGKKPNSNILVSYKGSVMWSIPIDEAQTWLDFLRHFSEMWPRRLLFLRQKRQLSPEEWPKILNLASRTTVFLDLQLGPGPRLPARGVLKALDDTKEVPAKTTIKFADAESSKAPESDTPTPQNTPKPKPRVSPAPTPRPRSFSIFSCLEGVTKAPADTIDEAALRDQLQEVEDFILQKTSFSDRKAYKDCPEASRAAVHAEMEKRGSELAQSAMVTANGKRIGDDEIDIFNAADTVFGFFFPLGSVAPTVGKYWGALKQLLDENLSTLESDSEGFHISLTPAAGRIRTELRDLASTMTAFDDILKHTTPTDRAAIDIPPTLLQGWIHLLMGLVYTSSDPYKSERLLDDAKVLIDEAISDVVGCMGRKPLVERSVVLPLEIVSLVSLELLQNATPEFPSVSETYSSYLAGIESEIATKTSDRLYERRLALFRQEITIIRTTLGHQLAIFDALAQHARGTSPRHLHPHRRVINHTGLASRPSGYQSAPRSAGYAREDHAPGYYSSPAAVGERTRGVGPVEAGAFRELLVLECLQKADQLIRGFSGLEYQAFDLEESNKNMLDHTKDRQERAIYAFTIVTVIFLPLSSVASIFGMNTNDVRDMELGQWAYWAAAVPVTLAVIFFGLLFTGELGNLARWVRGWWGGEREFDAAAGAGVGMGVGGRRHGGARFYSFQEQPGRYRY